MRKYIILFFSVFPFLFACNRSGTSGDIIPKDQMVSLLTAIHLADGQMVNISPVPDTLYKYGTARFLSIFAKYHTDSAQFKKSYQYYCTQPDILVDIYAQVLKILQTKSDSLNKLLIKQNLARAKTPVKPTIAAPNGRYGVGLQPQVPLPTRGGPQKVKADGLTPKQRFQRRLDSLDRKKHLKKRHVTLSDK